jgi:hypothetical protein
MVGSGVFVGIAVGVDVGGADVVVELQATKPRLNSNRAKNIQGRRLMLSSAQG